MNQPRPMMISLSGLDLSFLQAKPPKRRKRKAKKSRASRRRNPE